ncbi:MAG: hypothetical protein EHM18_02280 [Acidobacteria bacterium]|nr:MAG: hypothetical protein EHM18_02280 [Acidobacteriota bacterium]
MNRNQEGSQRRADPSSQAGPKSARKQKRPEKETGALLEFTAQHETKKSVDTWWDTFSVADREERLRMTREALKTVKPDHPWYEDLFPEAIRELEESLSSGPYVAFLEELLDSRPDVFDLRSHWHALSVAAARISDDPPERLELIMRHVASVTKGIDDPHFALISMLRLGGQEIAAQLMIDTLIPLVDSSDLMPWGVDQLIAWAMFGANQRCAAAGASEEAIDESYQFLLRLGVEDCDDARRHQRAIALHWAGKIDRQWSSEDFSPQDKGRVGENVYFLLVDFMRWLSVCRGLPPVVSDELRHILIQCIDFMRRPANRLLTGLKRREFEPFLAAKLDFLCLDQGHAPAAVVAMLHLYDFLRERGLVDVPTRDSVRRVCAALWAELKDGMGSEWNRHAFLERWLPGDFPRTSAFARSAPRPRPTH